jgi:hypothetical protein
LDHSNIGFDYPYFKLVIRLTISIIARPEYTVHGERERERERDMHGINQWSLSHATRPSTAPPQGRTNWTNEEDSQTFDRRVWPLVGAATHESNVWILSDKGRKGENKWQIIWF